MAITALDALVSGWFLASQTITGDHVDLGGPAVRSRFGSLVSRPYQSVPLRAVHKSVHKSGPCAASLPLFQTCAIAQVCQLVSLAESLVAQSLGVPVGWCPVGEGNELAGHVFISYVRENSINVDQLQRTLESAGIRVWRDTADLWPGEDWRAKIRQAITEDALVFIACFSHESNARKRSYQNEELVLAIEELRLRRPGEPWLIPIRFDDCDVPDLDIGMGRTLASIQRADLFGDRSPENAARIVETVIRILQRRSARISPTTAELEPVVTMLSGSENDFDIEGGWSKPESRSEPRVEIRMASEWLAKQLRIDQGSELVSRHQLRRIDSAPWALQTSFYSMEFVRYGATRLLDVSNISEGMARYLANTLGIRLSTSRDEIGVRKPDSNEAAFLQIPDDGRVQVLEVNRTVFDERDIPALLTVIVYQANRNRVAYEQRIRRP